MEPTDRLQAALLRIAEQIHEKQAVIAALESEIERLEEKAKTLEEAKIILAGEALPRVDVLAKAGPQKELSLQEEILRCLERPLVPADGLTVWQVVDAVKRQGYPMASRKNFYSAVYTTLKRLEQKVEVEQATVDGVRHFRRKHLEADLF